MLNLIKFLYSRAHTKIAEKSLEIPINRRVLQGSLISPYLFGIYINDLIVNLTSKKITTLAYADDIACICENMDILKDAIHTIRNWCARNRIDLNASKSGYFMIVQNRPKESHQKEPIEGIPYTGITSILES